MLVAPSYQMEVSSIFSPSFDNLVSSSAPLEDFRSVVIEVCID